MTQQKQIDSSPSSLWQVSFTVPLEEGETYGSSLEEWSLDPGRGLFRGVSWEEKVEEKGLRWHFRLYFENPQDPSFLFQEVSLRLSLISTLLGSEEPPFTLEPVPQKDWVLETYASFPPLTIGPYYIHGSHITPPDSLGEGSIPLQIDAATAFGSGKHGTTYGCVEALLFLREHTFHSMVDVGCGSGILALIMAKTWPHSPVLAIDNDPIAVAVTQENAHLNGVGDSVVSLVAEGLDHPLIQEKKPFDLMTANILANPLCEMASSLSSAMMEGGYIILSGFLIDQALGVQEAYEKEGLTRVWYKEREGWVTLGMKKGCE